MGAFQPDLGKLTVCKNIMCIQTGTNKTNCIQHVLSLSLKRLLCIEPSTQLRGLRAQKEGTGWGGSQRGRDPSKRAVLSGHALASRLLAFPMHTL